MDDRTIHTLAKKVVRTALACATESTGASNAGSHLKQWVSRELCKRNYLGGYIERIPSSSFKPGPNQVVAVDLEYNCMTPSDKILPILEPELSSSRDKITKILHPDIAGIDLMKAAFGGVHMSYVLKLATACCSTQITQCLESGGFLNNLKRSSGSEENVMIAWYGKSKLSFR